MLVFKYAACQRDVFSHVGFVLEMFVPDRIKSW